MGSASLELDSSYSQVRRQKNKIKPFHLFVFALSFSSLLYLSLGSTSKPKERFIESPSPRVLSVLQDSVAKCKTLDLKPRPPPNFHSRTRSDRYEPGSKPIVIRNATLWTGNDNGNEVLESMDVFLSKGIITDISKTSGKEASKDAFEIDAAGKWLTPGIIDMHVHLGVGPVPSLPASEDVNTRTAPITPYLRSLDGLNQHDLSFLRTMAGGVTTGLVLPGSGGNMGGQAFPIKLRTPASHAPSDRVIDPPESLALPGRRRADLDFSTDVDDDGMKREDGSTSWRYMKMACGENARRFYSLTRMDEAYGFRTIFNRARLLKQKQDDFCETTLNLANSYEESGAQLPSSAEELHFPDDLELEAVVDILRGRVKVNTHCYTTTDLERMVAHTNEFKFNIAAFHHAHEAWLVPDVLKQTYGGTPAVAMFSANANYKLEAYFGTPFAGPILQSHNITPIYKSDHPVTDSRRVLNQAAQAHHFGLGSRESLRSVISAPAEALALDHRIGYLKKGWDADVVLWNNHPLALGATPVEVIVDGIRQLDKSYAPTKRFDGTREPAPKAPESANYTSEIARVEREATDFMEYRSYAYPTPVKKVTSVLLYNVGRIFTRGHSFSSDSNSTKGSISSIDLKGEGVVVLLDDKIFCSGSVSSCLGASINSIPKGLDSAVSEKVDLKHGDVLPGITTFGSPLGLADIVSEPATQDGPPSDAFDVSAPARQSAASALGLKAWPVARAADGLRLWGSHDIQRAHSAGVTTAIVPPMGTGFIRGISVRFDTGSEHPLDSETIRQEEVALHITLGKEQDAGDKPSISEQVGILRSLFAKGQEEGESFRGKKPSEKGVWSRVIDGDLPLVVETSSTSAIASLLSLIKPYPYLRLVISGATTASLKSYPKALKAANVSVLISPRTWAVNWEDLPSIPGPPLTPTNTLGVLLEVGVKVGLQIEEAWQASNALFDATWSAIDAGNLDERDIVALLSTNLESILDLDDTSAGVVAFDGPAFQYGSKPVVIGTPRGVEILP